MEKQTQYTDVERLLPNAPEGDEEEQQEGARTNSLSRHSRISAWLNDNTLANPVLFLTRLFAILGTLYLIRSFTSISTAFFEQRIVQEAQGLVRPAHPIEQSIEHVFNDTRQESSHSKAIVVASTSKEETMWIHEHFPDWQVNVYVVDDNDAELTLLHNIGREAAVYLTYIINHYYNLPDTMVFLHADRYQWHNDDPMYDGVMPVKNLQLDYVKQVGYTSLRCSWNPGCPIGLRPSADEPDSQFGIKHAYAEAFQHLFPDEVLPTEIGTACCAQFAITKEQIMKRKVWQYEAVREWLWATKLNSGRSGRVMEYMWHILFSKPAVLCPSAESCYCNTFGICNLTCTAQGNCRGRYQLPPWNKGIPKGWPYEGQGTNGYPVYGWWQKVYPDEEWGLGYIAEGMNQTIPVPEESVAHEGADEIEEAVSDVGLDFEDVAAAQDLSPDVDVAS